MHGADAARVSSPTRLRLIPPRLLPCLLWLAGATAGAAEPGSTLLTTFPNGLRLLVLPQPEAAVARVDVYVSLRDAARKPGLAHLVEHLMFCSSEGAPNGSLVDSLALNAGDFGGDTSLERIHLWSACLPTRLPQALAVETERIGRLRPTAGDLESERLRILGEYDQFQESDVRKGLVNRVTAMAYGAGWTAGDPLLGSREDIAAITIDDVTAFVAEAVRPERTVVLVSGPVDESEVVTAAAAGLGALPSATGASEPLPLPPPPSPGPCWIKRVEQDGDLLAVGFRLPCVTTDDIAMVYLAGTIMEREHGHPTLQFYGDEALLTLNVEFQRGNGPDAEVAGRAIAKFWDQTRRVVRNVEDSWTFERSRAANVKELRTQAAEPRSRAEWRAQRLAADAELPDVDALAAVNDTLSQARIAAFFTRHFVAERAYMGYAVGSGEETEFEWRDYLRWRVNPYAEFRRLHDALPADRIAPVLAAARDLPLGKSESVTLPNGIPVRVVTMPGADEFCIGGVRSFPFLFEGREARNAGRIFLYGAVVNLAYAPSDVAVEPPGYEPGMNTCLVPTIHSVMVVADGAAEEACAVAAAMKKRLKVDGLHRYVFMAVAEEAGTWAASIRELAHNRAAAWRFGRLCGPEHALAQWLQPDPKKIMNWDIHWAEGLHRRVCATDNLTLVAVGSLPAAEVERCFAGTFGRLMPPRPGPGPSLPTPAPGVVGRVFHNPSADVAEVTVTYAGGGPEAEAALSALDLAVIGIVVESRLRIAAAESGLDSLSINVGMYPIGSQALPVIDIATPAHQSADVLALALDQTATLRDRPIDADEEARARLLLVGPLIAILGDAMTTRDLLVNCGQFGAVPADPLADLCTPRPDLLAERAPRLFTRESAAWTVVADTTWAKISAIGGGRGD